MLYDSIRLLVKYSLGIKHVFSHMNICSLILKLVRKRNSIVSAEIVVSVVVVFF